MSEPISIQYEEYEALRLADYDAYSHLQAAEKMNVSRPTFTRIYEKVRKKLAQAFVEGRPMFIEGGDVEFDKQWYRCQDCNTVFHVSSEVNISCGACGSQQVEHLNESVRQWRNRGRKGAGYGNPSGKCICPNCQKEAEHTPGIPCTAMPCPDCEQPMIRKE